MVVPEIPDAWRCPATAVPPGQTARFRIRRGGRTLEGFVVNHEGRHYAYVNRCPHAGTPLDLWPNEFFTEDGQYLICATHGAVFGPETGLCLEGPCPGARLEALSVQLDRDSLLITSVSIASRDGGRAGGAAPAREERAR